MSSFEAGDHFAEPVIKGIREALSAREGLILSIEHLDVENDSNGEHLQHFRDMLVAKYGGKDVAAIITIDQPALQLALQMRERLAAAAPIIFGQIDDLPPADASLVPNSTGMLGGYDIERTLELMGELHPNSNTIVVVRDASPRGIWLYRDFSRAKKQFSERFKFRDSTGETIEGLEDELAGLGPDHLVFYLSYIEDAAGETLGYFESLDRVARATAVPVYGAVEDMVGYGIVGGYLQSSFQVGQALGRRAIVVLAGTSVETIPLIEETPHHYVFDFRELKRFGISSHDLPSDSRVINEPDTFYYRYHHYFWTAVAVFAALVAYMVQLLIGIRKREKARRGLERLVQEGARPLPIDKPVDLIHEVFGRLKAIAPFLTPIGTYRYASAEGPFNSSNLAAFKDSGCPPTPRALQLFERAVKSGKNQYDGRDALLVLENQTVPADLAHLRSRHRLDVFDQRLVDLFTRHISIECDNIEALRLSSSLDAARLIQEAMLPKAFSEMTESYGVDLHAALRPARQVGGDLYDFFALDKDRLCVVVGDVSDKGVPAALFMSITRTLVRSAAETRTKPDAILEKVNSALCRDNSHMMFVTLFCGVYDRSKDELVYANAGHNPPLIRDAEGAVAEVPVDTNIALGVLEGASFPAQSLALPSGTTLLLYTDGITEAMNAQGECYEERRLTEAFAAAGSGPANRLVSALTSAVEAFVAGAPQSDDYTLLCLKTPGAA
ncbi:MAG: SpoIIE family protein phosphatase [Minwuiales bacterium]|nr:SpoIIE family protein phosphatase [Minwuiales bacterium]